MLRNKWLLISLIIALSCCHRAAMAYAYFGLEPDIVTNYLSTNSRKLGYVRVTVELMLEDESQLEVVAHHAPLLRATTIDIFGRQPEEK